MVLPGVAVCSLGETDISKSNWGAGCPTVKTSETSLLPRFGSGNPDVICHVIVWVPGVAGQGGAERASIGLPVGPGYSTGLPPIGLPSNRAISVMVCGYGSLVLNAVTTTPNVTGSPAFGDDGDNEGFDSLQSV